MTNASSGRMGWALAREARRLGASVVVVTGPCALKPLPRVRTLPVVSALQMRRAVLARCRKADIVIAAAAVSDWRFPEAFRHKVKGSRAALRLTLIPNPDIIKDVGRRRRKHPPQILVGFALETRRRAAAAREKMLKKGLDLIVANGPSSLGGGTTSFSLLSRDERSPRVVARGSKAQAARAILREALALLDP
jgi:phosphopantothenoylcysteine decarboxylase/phosphopantothenate--cysteine ligase